MLSRPVHDMQVYNLLQARAAQGRIEGQNTGLMGAFINSLLTLSLPRANTSHMCGMCMA